MGDSPSPPPIPDPSLVAGTQQTYNTNAAVQSQAGSNLNQTTPFGSLSYTQTGTGPGGVPLYSANSTLAPDQQRLMDALNANKGAAGNWFNTLMNGANNNFGLSDASLANMDPSIRQALGLNTTAGNALSFGNYGTTDARAAVGDATSGITKRMIDQKVSYLQPYFDRDVSQLDARLRNQGLDPSSPAYAQSMDALKQSQNSSITNFLSTAEPQAFAEAQQSYGMPLSIATGISGLVNPALAPAASYLGQAGGYAGVGSTQMGGAPGMLGASAPTLPSWVNPAALNIAPANFQGASAAATDQANKNYQAELAQNQNMMSGLFGIGSAALGGWAKSGGLSSALGAIPMMSDRRLKRDIKRVDTWPNGLPMYSFKYIWDDIERLGVMADDVERFRPEAVSTIHGFKAVNYAMALA